MKKTLSCLLCAALVGTVLFSGCSFGKNNEEPKPEQKPKDTVPAVDYTPATGSSYLIIVSNNTDEDLVAFRGVTPKLNQLIGGIPAGPGGTHKLKLDKSIFPEDNIGFVVTLIKESDYKANYKDLAKLKGSPFANIFATYNSNGENTNVYEINAIKNGGAEIRIYNHSGMVVQLRQDGPKGIPLCVVPDEAEFSIYSVEANKNYKFWPVFQKYNSSTQNIMTVYPTYSSGRNKGKRVSRSTSLQPGENETYNTDDWLSPDFELNPGCAYLMIYNGTDDGLQFMDGGQTYLTPSGLDTIRRNKYLCYEIPMQVLSGNGDDTIYDEKRFATKGAYSLTNTTENQPLPEFTYKAGYMYKINVTGTQGEINFSKPVPYAKYNILGTTPDEEVKLLTEAEIAALD